MSSLMSILSLDQSSSCNSEACGIATGNSLVVEDCQPPIVNDVRWRATMTYSHEYRSQKTWHMSWLEWLSARTPDQLSFDNRNVSNVYHCLVVEIHELKISVCLTWKVWKVTQSWRSSILVQNELLMFMVCPVLYMHVHLMLNWWLLE